MDPSTRGALHVLTLEGLGVMSAIGGAIATQAALNFTYPAAGLGCQLPAVRLVTWTIMLAVIIWCFDCKITW
jgi:hypothetical protein